MSKNSMIREESQGRLFASYRIVICEFIEVRLDAGTVVFEGEFAKGLQELSIIHRENTLPLWID